MKSIRKFAIAASMLIASTAALAQVKDYRDIKTPPLHKMVVEQPKRVQLSNGMVIFLMEDHELPLIGVTLNIRGGARDFPAGKAGIASVYGHAWRTGGSEKQTGDQLDDFLEARAAHVETGADEDSTSISMNVLKTDFDTVFPIFMDLLEHPAFRQEKIELAKTQINTSISRRNDDPRGIASRESAKLVYGPDSPYTRQAEYATVKSITRDDLLAIHKRFVHPNNMILGVVGDFDSASMEKKLRAAFGSMPKGPDAPKSGDAPMHPAKPGVYAISKDDVTQTNLHFVHPGVRRDNPDLYSLAVLNEILSGGFSGRLMNEIRTVRGLAYSVGGGVGWDWDHPGVFSVSLSTKSGSTVEAMGAVKSVLSELQTKPITDEEMTQAKDSLLNAFIFTRDSKSEVLSQRLRLEFYGYPADWYDRYVPGVEKVTKADVVRVAKQYIHPEQASWLVVGNEKDYDKPLSTAGSVTNIDITIPEGDAKPATAGGAAAKPAASNAEGLALVKKVQDFVGGKAKIAAISATRGQVAMTMKTPAGEMAMDIDALAVYPDKQYSLMKTPMGEVTMVATPQAGFMAGPMGVQDLPGSRHDEMVKDMKRDMLSILRDADKPGHTFAAGGTEKIGDVNAQILDITVDGSSLRWYVDPATGRILRTVRSTAEGEVTADYEEWKDFGGVKFGTKVTRRRNGEVIARSEVKSIEINPTVDPKLFEKPAGK